MPPTRSMSISREAKSVLGLRRALFVSWAQLLATWSHGGPVIAALQFCDDAL